MTAVHETQGGAVLSPTRRRIALMALALGGFGIGSAEFFGTGKTVRVDATIDDLRLENVGAMVTGTGGHMVSLNAKVRKTLGKDVGDTVSVTITPR